MKKKLIAIVTSLAMVATMVPATAAAATKAAPQAIASTQANESQSAEYTAIAAELAANYRKSDDSGTVGTYDPDAVTYKENWDAHKALYDRVEALKTSTAEGSFVEYQIITGAITPSGDLATAYSDAALVKERYANLKAGYDRLSAVDTKIENAKTAIDKISNSIKASDPTVKAADDAYLTVLKAGATLVDGGADATSLGNATPVTKNAAASYIGAVRMQNLETADNIMAAADAIAAMEAVTESTYTSYSTQTNVAAANTAYKALSSAEQQRVANHAVYEQKIQSAKDTVAAGDAITALNNYITADAKPYTQATITALQDLMDKAIAAMKKVPKTLPDKVDTTVSGTNWDATIDSDGNDSYKHGTAQTRLQAMKDFVKNDEAIAPFVKALRALDANMTWSAANKDKAFDVTYQHDQLPTSPTNLQTFFSTNYTDESAKYDKLFSANTGDWYKQEAGNTAAVKAWLEAKVDAIPAAVTIENRDAVEQAQAAYDEYSTGGYLAGLGITLDATRLDKLNSATKTMNTLVANKLTADKAAAKPFMDKMGADATTVGKLWKKIEDGNLDLSDKALVEEARGLYDKLTDDQKALEENDCNVVGAYEALVEAEKKIAELEEKGDHATIVNQLIVAIRALPQNPTLTDKDAVYALNDRYLAAVKADDTIPGDVTNKTDLFKAVGTVMDLEIAALPILKGDGTDTQEEIAAAAEPIKAVKERYDGIGADQQRQVTKASVLNQAIEQLSKAQIAAATALLEAAAAIDPTQELTTEDIAAIRAAKEAVEALTAEQQRGLDVVALKKLNEELIPALEAYEVEILKLENATVAIADAESLTYDGNAKTPAVTVTDKGGKTVADTEYNVHYSNNVNAGTATAIVSAKSGSEYTGSVTADFTIAKADINTAAKANAITAKTYTKKAITPAVTVKAGDKTLASGTDYTVSYAKNTNIGQATATIKGTGNYEGTITTSFIIKPAKGKITSLKAGKKQITVSYETQKAQSGKTGYRIICKTTGIKATGINTTAAGKKTVTKLKSGKTYQVKVRAYKTIGGTKYYGSYSTVKKVKVK